MNSKEISDKKEMIDTINECDVCTIGFCDGDIPYVLPFNFAFDENEDILYIHSGPGGRKENIIAKNNNVCVAFSHKHKIYFQNENVACSWGMLFKSVLLWGKIVEVDNIDEKIRLMNLIMKKYSRRSDFSYSNPAINNVKLFKIKVDKISGKKRGY
ncbi:MAG: pyridoxamine 5'-phosphate oxidase family protein [Bacteroidales bacterium]|jgi:nitroimidazol reductase NimA-like FMN-containing flavoprotein (pyridoxamine 5'-phosphate oxidase superfamily)|nr:pyridoxamine 5'-phosphate oxidase family protein [Bacteroidales bacterium]